MRKFKKEFVETKEIKFKLFIGLNYEPGNRPVSDKFFSEIETDGFLSLPLRDLMILDVYIQNRIEQIKARRLITVEESSST